jgi:hypothetical protein
MGRIKKEDSPKHTRGALNMSTDKSTAFLKGRKRAMALHDYMISKRKRIREKYAVTGVLADDTGIEDRRQGEGVDVFATQPREISTTAQLSGESVFVAEPPPSVDAASEQLSVATHVTQLRRRRGGVQYPNRVTQTGHRGNVDVKRKETPTVQYELVAQTGKEKRTEQLTPVKNRDESVPTAVEPRGAGIMEILASTLRFEVAKQQEFLDSQQTFANSVGGSSDVGSVVDAACSVQATGVELVEFEAEQFPVTVLDPPDYSVNEDEYCGLALFSENFGM